MSITARPILSWSDLERIEKVAEAIEARFADYAVAHQFAIIDIDTLELARIALEAMEVLSNDD